MATILIVEDEDDLRLLLRLSLMSEPHQILEAATGAEAAEQWSSADLILLDISLPDIDGLDLLRGTRDNAASVDDAASVNGATVNGASVNGASVKGAKVIAISAHAGADFRAAAIEAGCVDYLTKPFRPTELLEAIRGHLPPAP
jgi:CheY-like chemotaxis protein